MESIGFRLKKIREGKKLSLEDISKRTKLSLDVLKALEEDRFTPYAPAYIKGFLKIYSEFLGIDPSDLISEYNKIFIFEEKEIISKKIPSKKIKIYPKLRKSIPFILILILSFSFIFGCYILGRKFSLKKSIPSKEVILKREVISPLKELRIALRAKEDCWIKVRVDGKTVFQSILKKGRQESWQAEKKIELDVGNAQALVLEVNGKILSPLGRKGQRIKNILITKEGVKIGE